MLWHHNDNGFVGNYLENQTRFSIGFRLHFDDLHAVAWDPAHRSLLHRVNKKSRRSQWRGLLPGIYLGNYSGQWVLFLDRNSNLHFCHEVPLKFNSNVGQEALLHLQVYQCDVVGCDCGFFCDCDRRCLILTCQVPWASERREFSIVVGLPKWALHCVKWVYYVALAFVTLLQLVYPMLRHLEDLRDHSEA